MTVVGPGASAQDLRLAVGYPFGTRWHRPRPITVSLDERSRHGLSVGRSGVGKSTFARCCICGDIAARRGTTVIDAQDLARQTLADLAEVLLPGSPNAKQIARLEDRLVIIEPSPDLDQQYGVPGINLLEVTGGQTPYQVVDGLVEVIGEIWPDAMGDRMRDIIRMSLLLLIEFDLTFVELLPLLTDDGFRQALVNRSTNPDLRMYFNEHLGGLGGATIRLWLESTRNKAAAVIQNPLIRGILGQRKSTIDFRAILDGQKVLLVNLSRDKLKDSRRLLGALIVWLLDQAAISRENTPPDQRYFHAIVVDEFQDYFCQPFLRLLESGRKYGVAMFLLHQNLTQAPLDMRPSITDTILTNTATKVIFSLARQDADRLSAELFYPTAVEPKFVYSQLGVPSQPAAYWSLSEEREHYTGELMRQRVGEAYIGFNGLSRKHSLYVGRIAQLPVIAPNRYKIHLLRARVAERYYRPLAEVEREIVQRQQAIRAPLAPPAPGATDFNT